MKYRNFITLFCLFGLVISDGLAGEDNTARSNNEPKSSNHIIESIRDKAFFLGEAVFASYLGWFAGGFVTVPLVIMPFEKSLHTVSRSVALGAGPACIGAGYGAYKLYKKLMNKNGVKNKSSYKQLFFECITLGCFSLGVYFTMRCFYDNCTPVPIGAIVWLE